MIIRILPPKYVRNANQWTVTWFEVDPKAKTGKEKQVQAWFSTKEEANNFTPPQ